MEYLIILLEKTLMNNGIIIAAASYVLAEMIKMFFPACKRYIPFITGLAGLLLGIFVPDIFEGKTLIYRMIVGMAVGWGSAGLIESWKKYRKNSRN